MQIIREEAVEATRSGTPGATIQMHGSGNSMAQVDLKPIPTKPAPKPKVDVVVLTYRTWNAFSYAMIVQMVKHTEKAGYDVQMHNPIGNSVIHRARNDSLRLVRTDSDYILFVDDDMLPPKDAAVRLLKRAQDTDAGGIAGLFTTRSLPIRYSLFLYNEKEDAFYMCAQANPGHFLYGSYGTGMSFFLLRRGAFTQLTKDFYEGGDWMRNNRDMLKRVGVSDEATDAERRRVAKQRGEHAMRDMGWIELFDWDRSTQDIALQFSEDLSLCRRMIQLGIPIGVDTSVQIGHRGDYGYGPWNAGAKFDHEVQFRGGVPVAPMRQPNGMEV